MESAHHIRALVTTRIPLVGSLPPVVVMSFSATHSVFARVLATHTALLFGTKCNNRYSYVAFFQRILNLYLQTTIHLRTANSYVVLFW